MKRYVVTTITLEQSNYAYDGVQEKYDEMNLRAHQNVLNLINNTQDDQKERLRALDKLQALGIGREFSITFRDIAQYHIMRID